MVSVVRRTVLMAASFAVGAMLAGPVLAQQKITVGAYPSNPPWEFKNEKGKFEGFEIDLIKEIGKRLGVDRSSSRTWASRRCSPPRAPAASMSRSRPSPSPRSAQEPVLHAALL